MTGNIVFVSYVKDQGSRMESKEINRRDVSEFQNHMFYSLT